MLYDLMPKTPCSATYLVTAFVTLLEVDLKLSGLLRDWCVIQDWAELGT